MIVDVEIADDGGGRFRLASLDLDDEEDVEMI